MDRSGFQFEFHSEAPYLAFELVAEADSRLSALAADHPNIASASVDVEEVAQEENNSSYLARIVLYSGPESIEVEEKGESLEESLLGVLEAIERQVRSRVKPRSENMALFKNRTDAGQKLAQKLLAYAYRPDVIVLALPRGGVPVAFEVAKTLQAPLDIFLVRKLGTPGHEELAMGAIASGGVWILNDFVVQGLNISPEIINRVAAHEQQELERRERAYRGNRPKPEVKDRTVILIDDGLATGASMRAAIEALRLQHPARIVVAVPTGAPETCAAFAAEVDEIICGTTPQPFLGVGAWYEDFSQVTDAEVRGLLAQAVQPELQLQ